jgi:hypothetical protein
MLMILTSDMYVPAIRWRQGEYQALHRLTNRTKERVVPLITIPEVEFDFEERRPKKSVQEHVHPFAARYKSKWANRPAWVGVHKSIVLSKMDDGRDIFTYVFDELRAFQASAVPAIPLGANPSTVGAVAAIVKRDCLGAAISVRLEDLMKPTPTAVIRTLVATLRADLSNTDLIIDLGAPNFEPYVTFSGALIMALRRLSDLDVFRNFVLIGTGIPETFKDVGKGFDEIPRHDWLFYQTLIAKLPAGMRRPTFETTRSCILISPLLICGKSSQRGKSFTRRRETGPYAKAAPFATIPPKCTTIVRISSKDPFSRALAIQVAMTTSRNALSVEKAPAIRRDGKTWRLIIILPMC